MARTIKRDTFELSEFVVTKMAELELTPPKLAEKTDCNLVTIYNLINCNVDTSFYRAKDILNALGSSFTEFEIWEKGRFKK